MKLKAGKVQRKSTQEPKGNQPKPTSKTDFLKDLSKRKARSPIMSLQNQASMSKRTAVLLI